MIKRLRWIFWDYWRRKRLLKVFVEKNRRKLVDYERQNPGRVPPIYFDTEKKEFIWVSRPHARKLNLER